MFHDFIVTDFKVMSTLFLKKMDAGQPLASHRLVAILTASSNGSRLLSLVRYNSFAIALSVVRPKRVSLSRQESNLREFGEDCNPLLLSSPPICRSDRTRGHKLIIKRTVYNSDRKPQDVNTFLYVATCWWSVSWGKSPAALPQVTDGQLLKTEARPLRRALCIPKKLLKNKWCLIQSWIYPFLYKSCRILFGKTLFD